MADESTWEFLRNTRKKRDEKAKNEEAARGDKADATQLAEDKALGKRPMKEKASLKRLAAEAPEVLAPKRSGNLVIREVSEVPPKSKNAEKTPAKETLAKETSKEAPGEARKSPQAQGPSFSFYIPCINDKFADRSALEDPDLARAFARDAITPRDFMEMKKSTVEQNIKTAVCLAYQAMATSACTLREYESQVNQFGVAEALFNKARAIGHREIKAREAAEAKLKLVEQQATQTAADLQKRMSKVEELQGKNAELAKETELRQIELATERSKTSELERLLREERARNDELQASLKARSEAEELMKAEAIQAHLKSAKYKDKLGAQLLEAYDEAFLDCKKRVAELFPDLDVSNLKPPELP